MRRLFCYYAKTITMMIGYKYSDLPKMLKKQLQNFEIFDFELTNEEMEKIRQLEKGKRFFNMTLEEQERNLGAWKPED